MMPKPFANVVWLGAGSAEGLTSLLDTVDRAILIEARKSACAKLKREFPQSCIGIYNHLLTVDGNSVEFTEYSYPEFSTIHSISDINKLFPGIKAINSEIKTSKKISEFFHELQLNCNNNILILDILDCNFSFLNELIISGHIKKFIEIRVQTMRESVNFGAGTASEITEFLHDNGYLLTQTINKDPDFPQLFFTLNPLLEKLNLEKVHAENISNDLAKKTEEVDVLRKEIKELIDKEKGFSSEASGLIRQNSELQSYIDLQNKELQRIKADLLAKEQKLGLEEKENKRKVHELQISLDAFLKNEDSRLEKIHDLEFSNKELREQNMQLTKKISAVEKELLKAEAQVEIIKDLLLKSQ